LAWAKNLQPVIVEFEPGQRTSLTMVRTSRRLSSAMVREITAALTRHLEMDEDE
jgi:predicted nucleotidyltransferase